MPVLVELNVCAIVEPQDEAQDEAPLTLPENKAAVQVKVVPLTVEFNAMLVAEPVQID